ncbi:MAG: SusC/RagA family TonB-linked outer membrane protein [Bacteroidota bacterium]
MKLKLLWCKQYLPFLCLLTTPILYAQQTIRGTISDGVTGETLIGANILIDNGSGIGTATDFDGKYTLTIPAGVNLVTVSYTGYQTQEVAINGRTVVDVQLSSGEILEEVVVIGYGTIKREDATGSIQSVSSKDFNRGALTGPQELLAGKVAGVSISTSGDPGGGSKIRIRGESSLNASNDPLIVIDGIPLDNGTIAGNRNPLDVINPNDVETFTVLKDASATAIYGNRAAGGVILITTKKGKSQQKLQIGYAGNVSTGQVFNEVDVLDAREYRAVINDLHGDDPDVLAALGEANTDWQKEIYQNAFGHEHNLNFSGGIKKLPYRLSVGFLDKNGVLKTDNYQRTSLGLNVNPGYLDNRLQVNLGLKGVWSNNRFAERGAIGNALSFDPTQATLDPNSPYGGFTTWVDNNGNPQFIAPTNPLAQLNLREDKSSVTRIIANASADYRFSFLPALRANLNLGFDQSKSDGSIFVPTNAAFAFDALNGGGTNNRYAEEKTNRLFEFYLNYKKDLGVNELDFMVGYSWQNFKFENSFTNSDVAGTPAETVTGSDANELVLASVFGRLNYSLYDRFLLTFSLRRDGTSRFSPDNRWGLFPAAALAIKAVENDNNVFNSVKVRAGWGITGQENIGNRYAYLPQYTFGFDNAGYQLGNGIVQTLRPEGYDANIKWEETTTVNIGVDVSIVKDRVSGSIDVYERKTKDLLNRIPVPAGTNLTNFITTNVGDMTNRGLEMAFNLTPVSTDNFTWDLSVNTAYNENEITKLTASDDPNYQGIQVGGIAGGVGSNIQIHSVGFPPFSFYVKEQLYDDAGNILEGQFADLNGDGADNDFYRFQKPAADWTYGLTSNITYKDFSLSFAARALTGNYVYNNVATSMGYLDRLVTSQEVLYNVHRSAVDLNVFQQGNLTFSDNYISDASFFRVDHVTLSYRLTNIIKYINNVYFTIQNPLLITNYDGLDPEIFEGTDDSPKLGIDDNLYPRPRTFVFGLSAQF